MSPDKRAEVKQVARELLNKFKPVPVPNWRQKASVRSELKPGIENASTTACLAPMTNYSTSKSVPPQLNTFTEAIRTVS